MINFTVFVINAATVGTHRYLYLIKHNSTVHWIDTEIPTGTVQTYSITTNQMTSLQMQRTFKTTTLIYSIQSDLNFEKTANNICYSSNFAKQKHRPFFKTDTIYDVISTIFHIGGTELSTKLNWIVWTGIKNSQRSNAN